MRQYHNILKTIIAFGSWKPAAREGMPKTLSLFGHQEEYDLSDGFPILTTKKIYWKGVVAELLWFLRGDVNIKFLDELGVRKMWHEDAYNYYVSMAKKGLDSYNLYRVGEAPIKIMTFEEFCKTIAEEESYSLPGSNYRDGDTVKSYKLGDCGFQYGKVWRNWKNGPKTIDQIANVIRSLKTNPFGRRHIVTAIDPAHDQDLALYWCHAMFQFNVTVLSKGERAQHCLDKLREMGKYAERETLFMKSDDDADKEMDSLNVPKYQLDLHLTQRSGDVFLGVPLNISSYCLLLHIIGKICNMVPGRFIHSLGDVHIYENHMDAVNEQLTRDFNKHTLPDLVINPEVNWDLIGKTGDFTSLKVEDFTLANYESYPKITAELSTGMQK